MPTNIRQQIDNDRNRVVLHITGEMTLPDALVVQTVALEMKESTRKQIVVDLAELSLLDSESAPILKRLEADEGIVLEGVAIFLQSAINAAERKGRQS